MDAMSFSEETPVGWAEDNGVGVASTIREHL